MFLITEKNQNEKKVNVSVVFVQYNPDLEKTLLSLYALINQKNVNFEIIIVDDGSKEDHFRDIKLFFQKYSFTDYRFHKNNPNVGTVKNLLSGIELSRGEYIFMNSPGDILKDEYALRDLYRFSSYHKAKCVFSRAIYYHKEMTDYKLFVKHCDPLKPKAFVWYMPQLLGKYSLFNRYWILGAVFFRSREYALKYMRAIENTSRLVEDNTSALYSVMNGEKIIFYDRVLLWYEFEAPATDGNKSTSRSQISTDFSDTLQMIDERFAKDPLYDFFRPNQNRFIRILKHPFIKLCSVIFRVLPEEETSIGENFEEEIKLFIKDALINI